MARLHRPSANSTLFIPIAANVQIRRYGIVSWGLSEFYATLIRDAYKEFAEEGKDAKLARRAEIWLFEEEGDWDCMSFNIACQALGLEPDVFRAKLLTRTVTLDGPITRQSRTAGRYHKVGREE